MRFGELFQQFKDLYRLPPVLWPAFALLLPLGFINVASWKLYLPMLRSLVACDEPVTQYSGSLHCGDVNFVISVALQQEAWLVAIKLVLRMVSGPILGALCDQFGRKYVLLLSIGGFTVACFMMYIACCQQLVPPLVVLTAAMVLQGSTTAFGLCYKAMVADVCIDRTERAKGFVVFNHMDVLSRGAVIAFVIVVQKAQILHYERLCLAAFVVGSVLVFLCHRYVHETLNFHSSEAAAPALREAAAHRQNGDSKAVGVCTNGHSTPLKTNGSSKGWSLLRSVATTKPEWSGPFKLLWSSGFLQLRLLQMLLMRLAEGWESVQDSFMISVLGWGPGDWDLANVPISSGRELWGMLTSGAMVEWTKSPANRFWYIKATLAFGSTMAVVQSFAPWGSAFLLVPRYLLAMMPGDGGADQVFFSSQFSSENQATAQGLLTSMDNLMSGLARGIFARYFDPAARNWDATYPLVVRCVTLVLANFVCFYSWSKFGRATTNGNGKKD